MSSSVVNSLVHNDGLQNKLKMAKFRPPMDFNKEHLIVIKLDKVKICNYFGYFAIKLGMKLSTICKEYSLEGMK